MPLSVGIPFLYTDTPICWRRFFKFFVTIPKASTTTGVTVTFTRHNRATSLLKSWYFSNFSFSFSSMQASPRYRYVSYIWHCPCCLPKKHHVRPTIPNDVVNLDGPTAAFRHQTPQLTMRSVHTIYSHGACKRLYCVTVDVVSPTRWIDEIVYLTRCELCWVVIDRIRSFAFQLFFLFKLLFTPKAGIEVCFRSIT